MEFRINGDSDSDSDSDSDCGIGGVSSLVFGSKLRVMVLCFY